MVIDKIYIYHDKSVKFELKIDILKGELYNDSI